MKFNIQTAVAAIILCLAFSPSASAQVFTSKNTVAVSVNGGYIQSGGMVGVEGSYYVCNKPLFVFAGLNYTFRKPFPDNRQNDLLVQVGAGWTFPLKKDKGWTISPLLALAYDHVSVSNVKLGLEKQFNFGLTYGGQIEKSFKNTWTVGVFGKQLNTFTGSVKINDFFCGVSVKKAFNTFRFNK